MVMRFPANKKRRFRKTLTDFPPRKDGTLLPPSVALVLPSPSPQSLYRRADGRTYADVPTNISRINGLPKSPTQALAGSAIIHGALCYGYGAPLARELRFYDTVHQVVIALACLPPSSFTSKLNRG